jgi:hypothetical protein
MGALRRPESVGCSASNLPWRTDTPCDHPIQGCGKALHFSTNWAETRGKTHQRSQVLGYWAVGRCCAIAHASPPNPSGSPNQKPPPTTASGERSPCGQRHRGNSRCKLAQLTSRVSPKWNGVLLPARQAASHWISLGNPNAGGSPGPPTSAISPAASD